MHFRPPFVLLALLLVSACRDTNIKSYRVAAETPEKLPPILTGEVPAASDRTAMANTAVPTAGGEALSWTAPAHWKAKPGSAMRKGSYAIVGADGTEADLAITAFPGDVGGDLANINRWRGQLSLPPIGAAELSSATEHLDFNGLHMTFVDIAGTGDQPQRIIGVSVPYENATWFFKMMGPDAVVAGERNAFRQFVQTIKPSAPAAP
ncbi:MAG TPA: hypothetical protein VNR00_09620 [Opitutus sp.]|nr:hypothetical protein [Opitutus sp.]